MNPWRTWQETDHIVRHCGVPPSGSNLVLSIVFTNLDLLYWTQLTYYLNVLISWRWSYVPRNADFTQSAHIQYCRRAGNYLPEILGGRQPANGAQMIPVALPSRTDRGLSKASRHWFRNFDDHNGASLRSPGIGFKYLWI
jgi:hypothetical protein